MMGLSLPHLIVLALVVLLLFGRGKVSDLMGDFGKGIKSFKEGINDETTGRTVTPPAQLTAQPVVPAAAQPYAQPAQPYAQSVMTPAEVLPHGQVASVPPVQPGVQPAPGAPVQPMLNGEPLVDQQPR